jgi:CubicO group peptidase (beta-lactamase class C family)
MFNDPDYTPRSPNSGPLYSNMAFILLGMALENVHKKPYKQVIQDLILDPVGMTHSTFETPDDRSALLSRLAEHNDWLDGDIGFFNPTGGLCSTPDDMLAIIQVLLSNKLLTKAETRAWLQPRAFTSSFYQTVGLP